MMVIATIAALIGVSAIFLACEGRGTDHGVIGVALVVGAAVYVLT